VLVSTCGCATSILTVSIVEATGQLALSALTAKLRTAAPEARTAPTLAVQAVPAGAPSAQFHNLLEASL